MQPKNRSGLTGYIIVGIVALVVAGSLGAAAYMYKKYNDLRRNPNSVVIDKNKALLDKLSKITQLPSGEEPQIAAVEDKSKLGNDQFFNGVENGDYIIIYTKARRILVYRESANKIINQGPFSVNTQGKVKVGVLQSGSNSAAAETAKKAITDKLGQNLGVIDIVGSAKSQNYIKNQVIDLTGGQRTNETKSIAEAIKGEIKSSLPAGEQPPQDTEVVVIIAQ